MNPGNVLYDGYDLVRRDSVYRLEYRGVAIAYVRRHRPGRFLWWLLSGSDNKCESTLREAAYNAMCLHIETQAVQS